MRYFKNQFTDYVTGADVQIDRAKWKTCIETVIDTILKNFPPSPDSCDGSLYVGNIGVAYMLYYLSKHEQFREKRTVFLERAEEYVKVNQDFIARRKCKDPPSAFILGPAGVTATACLLSSAEGNTSRCDKYVEQYGAEAVRCMKIDFFKHGSDEMLIGRAGYLCGLLSLQQNLGRKV